VSAALAWLIWTTTRNRWVAQLQRVRNPRYAVALAVGILYFWWFLFRPMGGAGGRGPGTLLGSTSEALAPLILVLVLSGVWVFGGDRTALAFSEAEVAMLLTAPVPRRTLILYKLVRSQLAILISSMIWVFILRRGNTALPGVLSALGFWVMFMTLACQRLGAALVRASSQEHGGVGVRRNWLAIAVFGVVVLVLLSQLAGARAAFASAGNPGELFRAAAGAVSTLPSRIVLYPFHLLLAPTFARTAGEWARTMLPAVGLLALNTLWVLRSDAAFEEAAAEASALRAAQIEKFRARRRAAPVVKASPAARTLALSSTGSPAVAIVWKNMICLMRTSQFRTLLAPVTVSFIAAFAFAGRLGDAAMNIAVIASLMAMVLLLFGGRSLRNDLRGDMLHLPMLKSLPLSAPDLVVAEVVSGALPMAAAQFLLLVIAEVALMASRSELHLSGGLRAGVLIGSPVALIALNVAMFTLLNGAAVLFPAWTRLGPTGAAGIEAMGSNVLSMVGMLLGLVILLILPAAAVGLVLTLLRSQMALAVALGCIIGGVALGAESYALIRGVAGQFAKAEPGQVV
jgi:ABC-2 type transport system permease protein